MAVNSYQLLTPGTPISWKASGGDFALTLTSLPNATARQGVKGDLGAFWRRRYAVALAASCTSAPVAGTAVELYWCGSPNATAGTENPGGGLGTDSAFGTPAEAKFQLLFIGQLYLSNALGTAVQRQAFDFFPRFRFGFPVVVNSSGVALGTTAADHEVRLTPVDDANTTTATG